MLTAEDSDEEVALKLLGDRATPAAAPLLRLKLHSVTAANRPRIVGLALRALLASDPEAARIEAVPLLATPNLARGALGVFALTDPAVREELDPLDTTDDKAVTAAALKLLDHLEATTGDDELREAVRRTQKSFSSTIR